MDVVLRLRARTFSRGDLRLLTDNRRMDHASNRDPSDLEPVHRVRGDDACRSDWLRGCRPCHGLVCQALLHCIRRLQLFACFVDADYGT